ncbi:MAG: hypothetical protein AAF604_21195 [Acidobacteriota bacterium]
MTNFLLSPASRPSFRTLLSIGVATAFLASPVSAQPWAETFGGPGADLAYDIAAAADGGAFAGGLTNTDLLVDGYVVKTDADGQLLWQRSLSLSPKAETFYSILPTDDGGAVIAGSVDDAASPDYRPWLLALDAHGEILWSSEESFTADVHVDSAIVRAARLTDGRYVLAGGANTMVNPEDPWVLLATADGTFESFDRFETLGTPGFGVATYINNLAATPDGGFVATGTVSGGLGTAFLWKFDAHAQPEWSRLYQDAFFREGFSLRAITDGYVITGCDLPNCNNATIIRTDAGGAVQWTTVLDDPDGRRSFGRDVVARANGELVLLQTLDGGAGSRVIDTELITLSAAGERLTTDPLVVGQVSTAGYRLAQGDDRLWVGGYAGDSTAANDFDLLVAVAQDQAFGSLIFSSDFESGDLAGWSSHSD